jgi:hypothetical protein
LNYPHDYLRDLRHAALRPTSGINAGVTDQGGEFAPAFVKCAVEGVLENRSETVIQCNCGVCDFKVGTMVSKDNPFSWHTLLNEIQ